MINTIQIPFGLTHNSFYLFFYYDIEMHQSRQQACGAAKTDQSTMCGNNSCSSGADRNVAY